MKKLEQFPPKTIFLLGAVGGFLVLCTIGFFVLLTMVFFGDGKAANDAIVKGAPSVAPTPSAQPAGDGNIQLAAIIDDDWYKGAKDAPVTIIEFSDPECPFCARFHDTMNQVIDAYGDRVKWVYKHAPLDSLHSKARKEAEALECAGELGGNDGFWAYTDRLFSVTPSNNGLAASRLPQIAEDVGLNRSVFEDCLASGRYAQKVQHHLDEALAAGLQGTPYSVMVVGDQKIPVNGAQPYSQIAAMLDQILQ